MPWRKTRPRIQLVRLANPGHGRRRDRARRDRCGERRRRPLLANRTAEAVATAGLGTYLIGAPVVLTLAHRRAGAAFGSLGLRIGAPFLGYIAASTLEGCVGSDNANSCGSNAEAVGLLFGIGTAMALDAAFLARKSDDPERSPRTSSAPRPRLSPGIAVTGQSRALVLAGSF